MQEIDRITVDAISDSAREASLITGAHLLGFTDVRRIQVADVFFVAGGHGGHGGHVRSREVRLGDVLVDPLLQLGRWGTPDDPDGVVVIETALLPGVTDSVADAVLVASQSLGVEVSRCARCRGVRGGRLVPGDRTVRLLD